MRVVRHRFVKLATLQQQMYWQQWRKSRTSTALHRSVENNVQCILTSLFIKLYIVMPLFGDRRSVDCEKVTFIALFPPSPLSLPLSLPHTHITKRKS